MVLIVIIGDITSSMIYSKLKLGLAIKINTMAGLIVHNNSINVLSNCI
jgi:hypothetical protein